MSEILFCNKCGRISYNDPYFDKPGGKCCFCKTGRYINTEVDNKEASQHAIKYSKEKYNRYFYDLPINEQDEIYRELFYYGKLDSNTNESSVKGREKYENNYRNNISNSNLPKCPSCGSTDLKKISVPGKVLKVKLFGLLGTGDLGKTYKCNNCGVKF